MDQLLKKEIADIINAIQRSDAPKLKGCQPDVKIRNVAEHEFDLIDSKSELDFVVAAGEGTAHYKNGTPQSPYPLRFICYDDYLHLFTYDDGQGHTHRSRLKDGTKMADFIVIVTSPSKDYIIVHEISDQTNSNKRRGAKKQLSDTLNQLFKSKAIGEYISQFKHKLCYLSAKDGRQFEFGLIGNNIDGFSQIYKVLPEPVEFNFGQIKRYGFTAYESSIVVLE